MPMLPRALVEADPVPNPFPLVAAVLGIVMPNLVSLDAIPTPFSTPTPFVAETASPDSVVGGDSGSGSCSGSGRRNN